MSADSGNRGQARESPEKFPSIRRYLSRRWTPGGARATVLGAIEAVDLVTIFTDDTPADAIARLMPDVLVKGADYTVDAIVGADTVRAAGGRVLAVELVPGQSTTRLIAAGRKPEPVK
jgi:bifunctional ADP-heptose synthase (sugar kinase/adenylyltransferase)